MPGRNQFGAQFYVIVDFTIEHDADIAAAIPHWLGAASTVENGQDAMAKVNTNLIVTPVTIAIGTAIGDARSHLPYCFARSATDETSQAAHFRS
jgi:hypothetical protein